MGIKTNKEIRDFNYVDTNEQKKAIEDAAIICAMELGGGIVELEFMQEIIESFGYKNVNKSIIVSVLDFMAKEGEITKRGYYTWTIDELSSHPKKDGFLSMNEENIREAIQRYESPEALLDTLFGKDPVVKEELNRFFQKNGKNAFVGENGNAAENVEKEVDTGEDDKKEVDVKPPVRKEKKVKAEPFGELRQNDSGQWLFLKAEGIIKEWACAKKNVIVEVCDKGWRIRLPSDKQEEKLSRKVFFANQGKNSVKIILHNEVRLEPVVFESAQFMDEEVHLFKKESN